MGGYAASLLLRVDPRLQEGLWKGFEAPSTGLRFGWFG